MGLRVAHVGYRKRPTIELPYNAVLPVGTARWYGCSAATKGTVVSHIQTEIDGAVLRIAINRPGKKNALTAAMYEDLSDAFEQGEANSAIRVLLIRGNGDSFTAGNDLEDFLQQPWTGQGVPPAVRFMYAVARAKKPVIAAVQGAAVGIGTTILLHCDLVYAAEDAKLIMPFVNLGIVPEAGSTVLLPALIGHQRSAELLMLGSPLTAQRAYDLGLVNKVVPVDALLSTAMEAARKVSGQPANALRTTKQLLKRPLEGVLERAMQEEVEVVRQHLSSPETKEALTAFLEKRKPDFSKFQ
jgi:enoyl-CoA hydratase/carnithine racemase